MDCKYFYLFLENKKLKMTTHRFIPSKGVSEIYLDVPNMH